MGACHAALIVPMLIALIGAAVMATAIRRHAGDTTSASEPEWPGG